MDNIIQDQLASLWWLLSPLGVALWVGLTTLMLLGVPARIIEVVYSIRGRHHLARRTPLASSGAVAAYEDGHSARMGG